MKMSIYIFALLPIFFSCKGGLSNKKAISLIQEWQGKEIIFPDNIAFTSYTDSVIDYRIPASEYKVLAYVDSAGCTDCLLRHVK
jgi:hypothetical protein